MKLDLPIDQVLPALDNIVRTRSPEPRSLFPRDEEVRKATEMLYLPHVRSGRYAYETFREGRISDAVRCVVRMVENTKSRNKRR
jgi:hypothetical protein